MELKELANSLAQILSGYDDEVEDVRYINDFKANPEYSYIGVDFHDGSFLEITMSLQKTKKKEEN